MAAAAWPRSVASVGSARGARLDAIADLLDGHGAVALVAPPGFGKTVALHRIRRRAITRGHRVAWVDAAADMDSAAIAGAAGASGEGGDPAERMHMLVREAQAPVTLFVDGAERLSTDCAAMLDRLLTDQRPGWHLVLAGRTLPAALGGERHRAYGALAEVGEDRLAFRTAEVLDLLAGRPSDDAALRQGLDAVALADGWPVAVDLALRAGENGERATRLASDIAAWLDRHAWAELSAEQRAFAADLALLGSSRLDPALTFAATGRDDTAALLADLSRRTPFLRRDGAGSFCLRTFAIAYLAERRAGKGDRRHRHARLAGAFHAQGDAYRAIPHAIAAERGDLTSAWIAEALRDAVARGNVAEALEWLGHLPPQQQLLREADLVIWVVWALAIGGLIDRARAWLDVLGADRQAAAALTPHARAVVEALLATVADDPDRALAEIGPFREIAADELPAPMRAVRDNCFRWIDQRVRVNDVDISHRRGRGEPPRDARQFYSFCFAAFRDAQALLHLGRSSDAIRLLDPLRAHAEAECGRESSPFRIVSTVLAAAHWQAGDSFAARVHLAAAGTATEATTIPDVLHLAHTTAARILADERDWAGALATLETLDDEARRRGFPRLEALGLAARVRVLVRADRRGGLAEPLAALQRLRRASFDQGPIGGGLTRLAAALGCAHAALALKQPDDAAAMLAEASLLARAHNHRMDLAEIALLSPDADARFPVAIDAPDRRTLETELGLVRAPAAAPATAPVLTAKEREILDLLATGISNRQIAEAMLVSAETVKWHLKNIFNKLDVHDREHVIARARALASGH